MYKEYTYIESLKLSKVINALEHGSEKAYHVALLIAERITKKSIEFIELNTIQELKKLLANIEKGYLINNQQNI